RRDPSSRHPARIVKRADELARETDVAHREVFDRTLRLRAVLSFARHLHLAHRVSFDTKVFAGHRTSVGFNTAAKVASMMPD
ncbi:MAG TPA: hypothetical protein VMS25_02365, partial [Candidatus Limnocylindrales bacterium]|nr:hypothetical protein [Candidatus Limnocylindrales bacterium]